jgi:hypothetical protein
MAASIRREARRSRLPFDCDTPDQVGPAITKRAATLLQPIHDCTAEVIERLAVRRWERSIGAGFGKSQ